MLVKGATEMFQTQWKQQPLRMLPSVPYRNVGYGLVPSDNKPLPETMFAQIYVIRRHQATVS